MLTDVVMPGMNGIALGAALRDRRPDLPVLYMSGYSDPIASGRLADEQVLAKPFRRTAVLGRVRAMLDGARARGG